MWPLAYPSFGSGDIVTSTSFTYFHAAKNSTSFNLDELNKIQKEVGLTRVGVDRGPKLKLGSYGDCLFHYDFVARVLPTSLGLSIQSNLIF